MKPVIALVGRPNVGKSTLFNRLTRSRDAIVADFPGLTRDRHYGQGRMGERPFLVIDTGGFEPVAKDGIYHEMAKQTRQAVVEADIIIFIVDGRAGMNSHDQTIADDLRKTGRTVILAVNKAEGMRHANVTADFYALGLGDPVVISSAHGDGVRELLEYALDTVLEPAREDEWLDGVHDDDNDPFAKLDRLARDAEIEKILKSKETIKVVPQTERVDRPIKIAVVGRPNVGKSTLINTLIGEDRVIAFDMPGTTRDAIEIEFERQGRQYVLIDTAGLRKRGKVFEAIEKFSVVKTLQAISDANVVILMLDAAQDISEQDAHIAGFILESGRALVVAVNKWDAVNSYERDRVKVDILRKLVFLDFAKFHYTSALKGAGVDALLASVHDAHAAAFANLSTPQLTRVLYNAVEHQAPPRKGSGGARPKLRYAHQGGMNPPVVVIHGNTLDDIADSYRRFLEGRFRDAFKLQGTPLRIEFRSTKNPYADRKKR
ncbi:MAG: ribosome biogenesis GTPase Der [Formosimonas sp.]|jgi:GTP-binding protein